jgi:hypothetical protein
MLSIKPLRTIIATFSRLFGYGRRVHAASGGICQLCGYGGGGRADPDLWRQLTVEHLFGGSQGGHLDRIRAALRQRLPQLTTAEVKELADRVEIKNMVTACHFCNSLTSREIAPITMDEVIASAAGDTREEMLTSIATRLQPILEGSGCVCAGSLTWSEMPSMRRSPRS